jgi:hypothetical protein
MFFRRNSGTGKTILFQQKRQTVSFITMATTVSKEKISGAFLGALAADSLALGAHWCYDNELIASKLGKVDKLLKPTLNTYHGEKQAGDQTHVL